MSKRIINRTAIVIFVCFIFSFSLAWVTHAEDFPSKPITLVIPYSPGGSHDAHARAFTGVAHEHFGVPVLAVIKAGGGGTIGANYVAQSKPDGYTLLLGDPESIIQQPLVEDLPYSWESFVPIGRINYSSLIVLLHSDARWNSLKEFLDDAKAHPNKLSFGGVKGIDYIFDPLFLDAGVKLKFVPYAGAGPSLKGFLSGDYDLGPYFVSVAGDYITTGKLKAIGVTSPDRLLDFPNVPTLMEQGYDLEYAMFRTVFGPKGIPEARLKKLRESFDKTVHDKSFQSIVKRMGENILYMSGEDFEAYMPKAVERTKRNLQKLSGK